MHGTALVTDIPLIGVVAAALHALRFVPAYDARLLAAQVLIGASLILGAHLIAADKVRNATFYAIYI